MNRAENGASKSSRAVIENRRELSLAGIKNIVSFDEGLVVLESIDAVVTVDGKDLQITKMDTDSGEVVITGIVNGLVYSDKRGKAKRFGGLFGQGRRQ